METTSRFTSTESFSLVSICDERRWPFHIRRQTHTSSDEYIYIYIELPSAPAADNNNNSSISRRKERKNGSNLFYWSRITFDSILRPTKSSSTWCSVVLTIVISFPASSATHDSSAIDDTFHLARCAWDALRDLELRCRRQLSYTHVNWCYPWNTILATRGLINWHRLIHKNTSLHLSTHKYTHRQTEKDCRHTRIDLIQFK